MRKSEFGRTVLHLAEEILEKEEAERTEAEKRFLIDIDKLFNHIEKENIDECRNIL